MAEFPDHPFWDFSLKVYMAGGVGQACLELQDAHELDVNVLLFCLWVGASGRGALDDTQMSDVLDAVHDWHHNIVRELRTVRTYMKGGVGSAPTAITESLRQRIQKTEIDCEHAEQLMLAESIDLEDVPDRQTDDRLVDAIENISAYFRTFGTVSDADRGNLAHILGVAFDDKADDLLRTAAARL
jgi:uncharacterized protein (TIGR02444 family)